MIRYILFDPKSNSFVNIRNFSWTSGHEAEEVNSFGSFQEAERMINRFESLKGIEVVKVNKEVTLCM